jgi:hypothetical protein
MDPEVRSQIAGLVTRLVGSEEQTLRGKTIIGGKHEVDMNCLGSPSRSRHERPAHGASSSAWPLSTSLDAAFVDGDVRAARNDPARSNQW